MAITVARYTFSSWLRKGVGNRITEKDHLGTGASATKERSVVPVTVDVNQQPVSKNFALLGPGDIIGINPHAVVRTEPLRWITNFEPNYLAFIEFYDEDFLWRYTPASADGARLRPWLALLVLEETADESEFTRNEKRLPLPAVTVKKKEALPPHAEQWAFGHVHINQSYENASEFEEFLLSLHDLHHPNADNVISRLVSPRKLLPNRAYRAFVVPAFETGRMAGLGLSTENVEAQLPSWTAQSASVEFPYYYEWYFRTGENEDFESLVKLLEPRPMDKRVGIRDMDGSAPGFGMTTGTDIGQILPASEPQTVVGLEGALKSPTTKPKPEAIDTSRLFFHDLEAILNFPEDLKQSSNVEVDPVVSPPIYGENHALKHTVDVTAGGWLNQLNRDPRNRVPSGFGTNVVQKHQEDYVARAWQQVKKILEANRRILFSSFAMTAAQAITNNFVVLLKPAELLTVFSSVTKRIKGSPTTLRHQLENSTLPPAAVDTAMRRLIRPRGPYGRRLRAADPGFTHATLIEELNDGRISAAPPKQVPDTLITDEKAAKGMPHFPAWLVWVINHRLLLLILILLLLLLFGLFTRAWLAVAVLAVIAIALYFYLGRLLHRLRESEAITDPEQILEDVRGAPPRPGFGLVVDDQTHFTAGGGEDSLEAENFRAAAIALNERLGIQAPERPVIRFDLGNAVAKISDAMRPTIAFPKRLAGDVRFAFDPLWLAVPEHLVPAMAYPDFPDPMYEKLRDISSELFLPNLKLIPPNTISLLVTNPAFIESYMTGLNHEFGRELLWREYPTDTRGSYFRQFWDVKGIIADDPGLTAEELAEIYKDIEPLDAWPLASNLGSHRNKKRPQGNQLVLVVRGELLKKYPNTIIYAQKAHKGAKPKEPVIIEVETEAQMKDEIEFPLFRAEIQPDIRFFGFDMTVEQARGEANPQDAGDDWGWYFVIQQIPGEPRFGLDVEFDPDENPNTPITWDDMAWDRLPAGTAFLSTAAPPLPEFFGQLTQSLKDQWFRNSADMASILYQKPVMIAVHAKEMLENVAP
jgi:hypothetical protein